MSSEEAVGHALALARTFKVNLPKRFEDSPDCSHEKLAPSAKICTYNIKLSNAAHGFDVSRRRCEW
jgi:hypothetical protein